MSDRSSSRGGASASALHKSPMDQFLSLRTGLGSEGLPTQEQIDRVLAMLTEHPEQSADESDVPDEFSSESEYADETGYADDTQFADETEYADARYDNESEYTDESPRAREPQFPDETRFTRHTHVPPRSRLTDETEIPTESRYSGEHRSPAESHYPTESRYPDETRFPAESRFSDDTHPRTQSRVPAESRFRAEAKYPEETRFPEEPDFPEFDDLLASLDMGLAHPQPTNTGSAETRETDTRSMAPLGTDLTEEGLADEEVLEDEQAEEDELADEDLTYDEPADDLAFEELTSDDRTFDEPADEDLVQESASKPGTVHPIRPAFLPPLHPEGTTTPIRRNRPVSVPMPTPLTPAPAPIVLTPEIPEETSAPEEPPANSAPVASPEEPPAVPSTEPSPETSLASPVIPPAAPSLETSPAASVVPPVPTAPAVLPTPSIVLPPLPPLAQAPVPAPAPHVPPPLPPLTQPTFTISAELPATAPAAPAPPAPEESILPDDRYSDRELSWLAFNNRVLDLARDRIRVPLLERAKFLAIFSSNLDEFFMVRVAGLKRRIDNGLAQRGTSGLLPRELHEAILSTARDLVAEQSRVLIEEVLPELASKGIGILHWDDLTEAEKQRLTDLFRDRIYPILTPLAVDPSHPFPYISGLSLNLAVQLRNPETGARLFARIKVPNVLPRFLQISEGRFVPLEDVISHHLDTIFTGMEILRHTTFRVTRNEDVEVEEDDAENILFALESELLRRNVGRPPVRLEVQEDINSELLDTLASELDVTTQEIFFIKGPLDLTGLFSIADMDREDLKYPAFLPKTNPHLAEVETSQPADLFAALKKSDVLLHHPYDSFATSVQRFIEQAAADPQVLAIKQTLYRTSGDSPIVDALIEAAQAGKQVLALVEIKARFDEKANIAWARKLEKSGVHVVYGLVGLKTHCKLSLVIRDEGETLRRYCHIGTGNYNPKTARMYEDMGLLTSNPIITDDVARLFNHLSGMTAESHYRRLLVSPFGIRNGLLQMIDHEIELQKSGTPGRIRIKVNSIVDEATMDALYRASQAGVKVDLWVRGICAMRGEVPGLSDNIRIRSILGRFLEHSRLFWFDNGGNPQVGIGSADLMHRNLDRRVEALVQLTNKEHIDEIDSLFTLAFADTTASWWLTQDGWVPKTLDESGRPLTDLQEYLIQATSTRRSAA